MKFFRIQAGEEKSFLRHGWWKFYPDERKMDSLRCEWSWFTHFFGAHLGLATGEDAVQVYFACCLFAVWINLENYRLQRWLRDRIKRPDERFGNGREIGFSIHDWAIWVSIWCDPDESRSSDPWWQRMLVFHPIDFILGKPQYSEGDFKMEQVEIPMPEGVYPATCKLYEARWKRPRWFRTLRVKRADVTPVTGIPIPGKGESAYDCGEDATYSLTCPADTPLKAVVALVESVLDRRYRYGGKQWRPAAVVNTGRQK